ncbi:hypothetical protein GCM10022393_05070 [Aquimarina addita]|uniref:BLUF domain-containing protein n=1 Tax=Aquimarina addita TaxID=870485 RepID=A0ABP7XB66_9FLAO
MLQTIGYVSTVAPLLKNSEMKELFEFVKRTNSSLGITGILMYSDGNFFQVLEGEKEQLQNLFKKIQSDSRHYNVIKFFDRKITSCLFTQYQSSFSVISKKNEYRDLDVFLKNEKSSDPDNFRKILYLVDKFMKTS